MVVATLAQNQPPPLRPLLQGVMVLMRNDTKIGIVFVGSGSILSVAMGVFLNALPFTLMSGISISLVSFIWCKYFISKFEFGALDKVSALETRGISFGLLVVTLSILTIGMIFAIPMLKDGLFLLLFAPLGFLVMVSVFSFGAPYFVGAFVGWWAAHYVFKQTHHNNRVN